MKLVKLLLHIHSFTNSALIVASRTALSSVIGALQRIAFNGDPLQFMLIETTYQPFISLFHQTDMVKSHPELKAIRKLLLPYNTPPTAYIFSSRLRFRPRHRAPPRAPAGCA